MEAFRLNGSFATRITQFGVVFKDDYYDQTTIIKLDKGPKPKSRLYVISCGRRCRDETIGSLGRTIQQVYDTLPHLYVSLKTSDWEFYPTRCPSNAKEKVATINKELHKFWRKMAGSTNRSFSPLASPYTYRFMTEKARQSWVGEINNDSAKHQWFYRLMRAADEYNIEMCSNLKTAWLGVRTPHVGYMGLVGLQRYYMAPLGDHKTAIEAAFPPAVLLKKEVVV